MINLYEKDETNFKHNAYVLNEIIKAETEEEINEGFNVNITYPISDSKGLSGMLIPGVIIKLPTFDKRENQLFVIRRSKPSLDNLNVEAYAEHILTAKLDNNIVLDTYIESKTRQQAISQILSSTLHKHKFVTGSKDNNLSKNNLRIVRYSALDALIGNKDNTVVNRYGGELIYDNFNVNIIDSIGEDKGINVTYTKNITGANMTLEDTELITEIVPLGKDGLMLPEKSIKASNFDENNPYTKVIEFSSIGIVEAETDEDGNVTNKDEICTKEEAYEKLRQACLDKFNKEHVNVVDFNLDLNFVELADCIKFDGNDYSNIDSKVAIGDVINVNIKPFGIREKGRIYKIKRDNITGKLLGCEIGYKIKSLADTINKTNNKIDDTKKELSEDIEDAKEKAEKDNSKLKVVMEKRAEEIELSVTNEAEQRKAEFKVMDGKITSNVNAINKLDGKTEKLSSSIEQTAEEIKTCVKKDKFGSEIRQHFDEIVATINDGTEHKATFNSSGLHIDNGGFDISADGERQMWINRDGSIVVRDLMFDDDAFKTGSGLWSSLYNMKQAHFQELLTDRLTIKSNQFYINNGYDLDEYIRKVVSDMNND